MLKIGCCAAALLAMADLPAMAQTVMLEGPNRIRVSGKLISYDGTRWVIESAMGDIVLPATGVICISGDCPPGTERGESVAAATTGGSTGATATDETGVGDSAAAPGPDAGIDPSAAANRAGQPDVQTNIDTIPDAATSDDGFPEFGFADRPDSTPVEMPALDPPADVATAAPVVIPETEPEPEPELAPVVTPEPEPAPAPTTVAGGTLVLRGEEAAVLGLASSLLDNFTFLQGMDSVQTRGQDGRISGLELAPTDTMPDGRSILFDPVPASATGPQAGTDGAVLLRTARAGAPGETLLAHDAVVILTGPNNPVTDLRPGDLALMLAGEITNWRSLGGPDLPVQIVRLPQDNSATAELEAALLGPFGVSLSAAAQEASGGDALSDMVARTPGALGYAGYRDVRNAAVIGILDACGTPIRATAFSLKAGDYPLTLGVHLSGTSGEVDPLVQAIVDFSGTEIGRRTVRDAGFIDLGLEAFALDQQGQRIARVVLDPSVMDPPTTGLAFVDTISNARRLTLTLRPRADGALIGPEDLRAIRDLAADAAAGGLSGQELLVLGFADTSMDAARAQTLSRSWSQDAAAALRTELDAAGSNLPVRSMHFGQSAPLLCNGDPWSDRINRRVEIWVRSAT